MVGQADVDRSGNGRSEREASPARLRDDLEDLAHDILRLAELQIQLLGADARESLRQARGPLAAAGAAAVVGGACVTVGLVGLGWVLASTTGLSVGVALVLVAAAAFALSVAIAVRSWGAFLKAVDPLRRSQTEFRTNVEWIKRAVGKK
jgi:hypothetical protein